MLVVALLILLGMTGPPGALAFTCPVGCVCDTASTNCVNNAAMYGYSISMCVDCESNSLTAMPTVTSDTMALWIVGNPSLGPIISAAGFQFPATWTALRVL